MKYIDFLRVVFKPEIRREDLPKYVMLGKEAYEELVDDLKESGASVLDKASGVLILHDVEVTQNIDLLSSNGYALVFEEGPGNNPIKPLRLKRLNMDDEGWPD